MKKFLPLFFAASLLLNAALAYFAFTSAPAKPAASAARSASASPAPAAAPSVPGIDADAWANLETTDLPELVARLRDAGFPIEMIRAILAAQISESFAARRKALDPNADKRDFWKNRLPNPQVDLAMRQLSREHQKMMRELLGKDAEADDPMSAALQGRRLDGLPPEKADEVKAIMRDFDEQRQDLYAAGTYALDREKMAALEKAQRDTIARALTPQEFEEYELRNSNTASSLRYNLVAFNPTEEEFRMMFRLQQPFEEKYNLNSILGSGPMTQETMRERSNAQKLLTDQIKAGLSPDRAAEYDRATDYSYRQTSQLVARLEMPPETTGQVFAIYKDIQQRLSSTYSTRDLQARNQQLAVLAEEAKTKIGAVLGSRGFEAYKQYGGSWMQSLTPRPPPGAAGAGASGGGGGGVIIREAVRIAPGN